MNRKQLIDNLLKNWPAKIICLTIAIFLYLFYQASLIEKKSFVVPLEIQESGLVVHVGNIPTSVVINIRANENEIKAIFASDLRATVNLDNIVESGTYKLPIEVKISDKLMAIDPLEVKLKEEKLKIEVERLISKYVPVSPSIVGKVDEDYEIKTVTMNPATVQIKGPESLVNAINEVNTGRVNVSNAKTNFSVDTNYNLESRLVQIVDTNSCNATIVVEPKYIEKTFDNIPVRLLNMPENLELAEPVGTFSMTLNAPVTSLKKYNGNNNPVKIDLSGLSEPGQYNLPVRFAIPLNFKIINKTGETLKVNLKAKEIIQENNEQNVNENSNSTNINRE